MPADTGALATDLYQLTMLQCYHRAGMRDVAVFEFFARRLPKTRNFFVAAGLEQALDVLASLRFSPDDLAWLASSGYLRPDFVESLAAWRFTGDVHALPEGTVFFPDEPLLRITAPLPEAQLVESRLINVLQFPTLVASKAARCVIAAPGRPLVDFGFRRAHGVDAGITAARAAYLAGFAGTATVAAGKAFGIPLFGTMAHALIQAGGDERTTFLNFARACPGNVTLLIDTYDTDEGARTAVRAAHELRGEGISVQSVRIDSGDLAESARRVRRVLDEGGLTETKIFVSGGLDEQQLAVLNASSAPIDGYGVGTTLDVSADAPYMECAYKLVSYAGRPTRKRSEGKASWPAAKQVYRSYDAAGKMAGDVITVDGDAQPGTPLLQPVMRAGCRIAPSEPLSAIRERAAEELSRLPTPLRSLDTRAEYLVTISPALKAAAAEADRLVAEFRAAAR